MDIAFVNPRRAAQIVTVGGIGAQINSLDSNGIQMAIDTLKERGGGVVKLGEGVFDIMAPIRLYDNISLEGSGEKTILRKVDGFKTRFVVDADYGELQAVVEDASGFKVGMGIQLYDSIFAEDWAVCTAVITAIEGNTIYFDNHLLRDYSSELDGFVSNACSVIEGVSLKNIKVSHLAIDGNKATNDFINGCRGGAIYFYKSADCIVENVKISDFNGDGISWQITEDITVRDTEITGITRLGVHPGTGSLRTIVENCNLHNNGSDGIFVCWRVQKSLFKGNKIHHNGDSGINIGHKDTHNIFEDNHIYENGLYGVHMRPETDLNGAHSNIYRRNIVENNGSGEGGYGFFIDSMAKDVIIEDNIIRDTGKNLQRAGIVINHRVENLEIRNNEMAGHGEGDVVDRTKK